MTTLIPIGGGADNDGWTPEARRACAFDILGREGGLLAKRGKVLFHTDFSSGELEGWRQHFNGFEPRPPVGLTSYPTRNGAYAMMISTGDIPYNANDRSNGSGTYKNLSLYRSTGVVSFSGWTTVRSGIGTQAQSTELDGRAWRSWQFMMDIQRWGSTSRSFPSISLIEPSGSTTPQWYIRGDDNTYIAIPDSAGLFSGENENKFNWDYWRLSWDLDANDGLGGYLEFQINDRVFDLRNLGGGSAEHDPQEGLPFDSFSGGFNCGLGIERSTKHQDFYPATLYAGDLVCTFGDTKA